jgi:hypothetical protein
MPTQRFMIAPLGGQQTDLRPWKIPDEAFEELTNAYVFRGRVRKRFGSSLLSGAVTDSTAPQLSSRLRIKIGTTDVLGDFPLMVVPGVEWNVGQAFSIGDVVYQVVQAGDHVMPDSANSATGSFNTATGQVDFAGADSLTDVYYYPATPVMGFAQFRNGPINNQPTFAWDTQFAYEFSGTGWERLDGEAMAGAATWTGSDSQFFWATTYTPLVSRIPLLFVTNFNAAEPNFMRYWNSSTNQWNNFNPSVIDPAVTAGNNVVTARIIVTFRNRIVLLNTIENNSFSGGQVAYPNRARWSQIGASPANADFMWQAVGLTSGLLDNLQNNEAIVTAQFIKDRLIVYYERSTWELVYTGNDVQPFRWQQINTELGAESTFSEVPFDKVVLGIGNTGIHACNGSNVERIDNAIPDDVFDIHNNNSGVARVFGIRDYFTEMVYWTYPAPGPNTTFPTEVLTYNYKTGTWAYNIDSITAFGYFQQTTNITWANSPQSWSESPDPWNSGQLLNQALQVIAGNQEGFTFIINRDDTSNAQALQVNKIEVDTDPFYLIITVIDHNLPVGEYVQFKTLSGTFVGLNNNIFAVNKVIDKDTFVIYTLNRGVTNGVYYAGSTIARVSNIKILTKQYNFFDREDKNVAISKIDFLVDKTSSGQVTIDFGVSSGSNSMLDDSTDSDAIIGTNVLETSPYADYPLEQQQARVWHPVYIQANGECIQLNMYMNDAQMITPNISLSDFQLHSIIFFATPSSRLQ